MKHLLIFSKIKKVFKQLITWFKTQKFSRLKYLDTFRIVDEFGSAGFMKISNIEAKCIDSEDGTFERSKEYAIEEHTRVYKTC